jgi:hypothetical protein
MSEHTDADLRRFIAAFRATALRFAADSFSARAAPPLARPRCGVRDTQQSL